jgi:outer membrane protein OmpA-like peptidoglycan-associated protein
MPIPFALRRLVTLCALALPLAAAPAAAQEMYPGQDVQVDPAAAGGARMLLYPGQKYMRVVPPLLQPGQKSRRLRPVHLHMPRKHHRTARRKPKIQPTHEARAPAPATQRAAMMPPKPAPKKPAPVSRPPARSGGPATIPLSLGEKKTASQPAAPPRRKPAPAPRTRTATATPPKTTPPKTTPPRAAPAGGLTKQAAILFDENADTLTDSSTARLKDLAFSLMTALANGAGQVELIGYGGAPGDKSSSARRISLKRALAVREALIVDGVPANRIDVRALGGVSDRGATDRVDIFVKG